jgi:transcriptional regulator with XRE-family HTH domain
MTNYQGCKAKLLNTILENKSTSALSKRMGFHFDKVRRWQNGSKQLRWNEFCDLCDSTKKPLSESLASTFGLIFKSKKQINKIVYHLKTFSQVKSVSCLCETLGISKAALQRYINGESYPDVEFVLAMMDLRPGFLNEFVECFTKKEISATQSMISLPWAGAVANAASLKKHLSLPEHSSSWIAGFLRISESQVNEAIKLMESLGLIERRGPHFAPTLSRTIGLQSAHQSVDFARYLKYWLKVASARYDTKDGIPKNVTGSPNNGGFRIFASSEESAARVSEIINSAEQAIHDLLVQDKNEKVDVRVFLFQHFSMQDF